MKDICIDELNRERCWNCGGQEFNAVDSLLTRIEEHVAAAAGTHRRCARCGEGNRVGHAQLYAGPKDASYAEEWRTEQAAVHASAEQPLLHEDFPSRGDPSDESAAVRKWLVGPPI
jgi:hypothetical protein